jgi:Rrf2 family protein
MKLSTRSTYGLRALVELAFAAGHGPVSATLIAKRQDLSVAYLEQLLHRLKKEGLVRSTRGPRGGYALARAASQISMGDVVRVLDGGDGSVNGKMRGLTRRSASAGGSRSGTRDGRRYAEQIAQTVWRCVSERLTQSLDAVSLQDLCDEVRAEAGEPLDHRYVFHI